MTEDKELALHFKLLGITTEEFALIEDGYKEEAQVRLGTFVNFGVDCENHVVSTVLKFQFEQNEKPFIILSARCDFEIQPEAWELLIDEESNKLVIPRGFASHLGVITVGTSRGILHEKLSNTPFSHFIIPPINLTKIIEGDVQLDLDSSNASEA